MSVVAKRYDEYAKMARQAAYGLPPEEAVKKIMGLASSGIPEFVLMSEAKKLLESSKPPAQAPQSTVKDKILAAAAPQQAMPQGMPQGMPQPGVPPQEMPQQAMPPMPPQGMAEGGSVNDYGVASLPGERGDEYAIDQGLGSLSADIDYAGGGIVSFAEGGRSNAQEILREGLRDPYQDEGYSRQVQEALYGATGGARGRSGRLPEEDENALLDAMSMLTRDEILAKKGLTPGYLSRDMMRDPTMGAPSFQTLTDPLTGDMGKEEFRSVAGGPSRWYRNPSLPKGPVKPAALEEPSVSAGLGGRKSVSLSRMGLESLAPITVPRIKDEDFPAAPQIQRTPEFDKDKRFKEQEELNTLYGVDPNYFNSRQEELQKERDALSGRVPQEAWASLGARGMEAFKARPREAPPTFLGGIGNLFGLMTQDLQKTNADIRQEKLALRREENTLRQADRAERMGNAEEAQRLRDSVEAKRLQEENAQREIDYNRAAALFEANAARSAEEREANLERELANMEGANRLAIARAGNKGSETLLEAMLKGTEFPASEINKLREEINSNPNVDTMVQAELENQGYGSGLFEDEAPPEKVAQVKASIVDSLMARHVQRIMEVQNANVARILSMVGGSNGSYTVEEN